MKCSPEHFLAIIIKVRARLENLPRNYALTIRKRRKELHYTQAYLAEFTGFSVSFISDLERGKTTAEIGKTIILINLLGLDLLVEERGDGA